jgi:hypothetical protein
MNDREIADLRGPSKLPPLSAVGRPCSPSLIPQKLPKNSQEERIGGVSI